MPSVLLADNAYGTIGAGLTISDTTLNFTTGHGARFPAVASGQQLYCCILNSSNQLEEIIITLHTAGADTATITRAAGSTSAKAWTAGDRIEARISKSAIAAYLNTNFNTRQDFRLTLTSGTPVTTGDVTAATTLYLTPYRGNGISLYDGTGVWTTINSAEVSLAVPAGVGTIYDIFAYDSAGVVTLEAAAWTNGTTRATALAYQNGVLVKSGATTRRYIGTIRTVGSGQCEDSVSSRYVWNYYNRVLRTLARYDSGSWTYTTAAFRAANGSTSNEVNFLIGVAEDIVKAQVAHHADNASIVNLYVGIGLDATNASSHTLNIGAQNQVASQTYAMYAKYEGIPAVGEHYFAWLEYSSATGATTWRAGSSSTNRSGLTAEVFA